MLESPRDQGLVSGIQRTPAEHYTSFPQKTRDIFLWQSAGPPCSEGTTALPLAAGTS